MILQDLNHILNKLAQHPDRETVLELGFALVEWMGLAPNADKKPQLVAPQTQKLKDYLAPAPQTVQPQLYRLSAEGQAIRVRFAVLKKIKKEYISQLVDNDPGLTSYQAFTKNLTVSGTAFVPSQPYFVHFVTTPEYDRLILIFNQGDQKRVLTFRNKLTQTQYNKIIQQWAGIAAKPKPEIADLFWQSLDIKEVNKEFYKQIKERFDALVGIAKATRVNAAENQVKQFAVRLIGRYIFCWFLKEKKIIPEDLLASKTIAARKANYYKQYLLHLFFNTLNTEVQNREVALGKDALYDHFIRIPYLNGGLFDKHKEDDLFNDIEINDWLLQFVKVLEEFDFTVDESHSTYQLVAIDPEMLGRIFENLLASQNPETEKMANQRKAFGAFYTPREIVDYMVDSSIKSYLEQKLMPSDAQEIAVEEPLPSYAGTLFQAMAPKQALLPVDAKKQNSAYETKRRSIQNKLEKLFSPSNAENPFDKHETAIVQEALREIKILDPACGSGAFPMGALLRLMELREMVGNSLSNSYELKSEILSRNIFGVDIMPMAVEIARLRAWLSLVLEAEYKPTDAKHNFGIKALPNLDFKFVCANTLIDSGYDGFLRHVESNAALRRLDGEIQKLERLRDQYFDPKGDKQVKVKLRKEFDATKEYIKTEFKGLRKSWNLEDFLSKVDDWDPFDDGKPSSFFSPAWMFGVKGGFDVVIGNPPYKVLNTNEPHLEKYKAAYQACVGGKLNLYKLFFEKGTTLLHNHGTLVFITPSNYLTSGDSLALRKFLLSNYKLKEIIDFEESKKIFENVTQAVTTFVGTKPFQRAHYIRYSKKDIWYFINQDKVSNSDDAFIKGTNEVIAKINSFQTKLDDIAAGWQGEINVSTKKAHFKEKISEGYRPLVRGQHIGHYMLIEKPTEYCPTTISARNHYNVPRLVIQEVANANLEKRVKGVILTDVLCGHTTNYLMPKNQAEYDLIFLMGLINSSLIDYYFKFYNQTNHVPIGEIKKIPIPNFSQSTIKTISALAARVAELTRVNQDVSKFIKQIDLLLFKEYGLAYADVKIVCPDFWLSEEEYKSFKLEGVSDANT